MTNEYNNAPAVPQINTDSVQREIAATLTDEQRQQVFRDAENRMMRDINLSWRNAVVDEVERAIAALREALQKIKSIAEQSTLTAPLAAIAIKALATTEPEPTGMPELPEADVSFEDGKDQYGYPEYDHAFSLERIKNYGEQCWKAGYKHGAWGDKPAAIRARSNIRK